MGQVGRELGGQAAAPEKTVKRGTPGTGPCAPHGTGTRHRGKRSGPPGHPSKGKLGGPLKP
jgi:hypothetical protein